MASSKMTPFLSLHPTSLPVIDGEGELECFGEIGELPESICIYVCVEFMMVTLASDLSTHYCVSGLKAVCEGSHRLSYPAVHYVSPP